MDPLKPAGNRDSERHEDAANDIRVTDRRRVYLDEEGTLGTSKQVETPSLKPTYVEELEERTRAAEKLAQEVQARFDQLRTQLQRETDETRQRLNRAADERAQREKAEFIAGLLPVLDNLQRATEAADSGRTAERISEGVRRTADSFESSLAAAGVEPIESVGHDFNPELHEAVDTGVVEPELDGKVVAEYTRGYRIGDRLLRPARVKVGRSSSQQQSAVRSN